MNELKNKASEVIDTIDPGFSLSFLYFQKTKTPPLTDGVENDEKM
jgi:hypothetical protein